jgi:uncharacterized membrane protein YbhN (UPF0104 family)
MLKNNDLLIIKIFNSMTTTSCCGQSAQISTPSNAGTNAPISPSQNTISLDIWLPTSLSKLGTCKFCMRASAVGLFISLGSLWLIVGLMPTEYSLIFGLSVIAVGFITLSLLHLIFFVKNRLEMS